MPWQQSPLEGGAVLFIGSTKSKQAKRFVLTTSKQGSSYTLGAGAGVSAHAPLVMAVTSSAAAAQAAAVLLIL